MRPLSARLQPHRLLAWVPAGVAVLFLVLALVGSEWIVGSALTRRSSDRVEQTARLHADQLARVLVQRTTQLQLLGGAPALANLDDTDALRDELQRLKRSSASYAWIGVADLQGRVRAGTDAQLEGTSLAQQPAFERGRDAAWVGPPRADGPRVVDLALPLRGADGRARGVLVSQIDTAFLDELRETALGDAAPAARRTLSLAVLARDGSPLLGTPPPVDPATLRAWLQRADGHGARLTPPDGPALMLARIPVQTNGLLPDTGWQVLASQQLDAALAPVTRLERELLLWGGGAALLFGGAGVWLSRRLARPYAELLDTVAERIRGVAAPADYLDALAEQARSLSPARADELPQGERLLAQLLYDAHRLASMLDQLPVPVVLVDPDGRVLHWSGACERVFGWRAADAVGRMLRELLPGAPAWPADAPSGLVEATVTRRDGAAVHALWETTELHRRDGTPVGVLATVRDLTAQRAADEQLHKQEQTLSAVIHAASDAVISTDADGTVLLFNPAAERIFGREAASMLGQPLSRLLPERSRERHGGDLRGFAESQVTRRAMGAGRVQGLRADGTELELEASISQVTVAGRKTLTAILRDVTDRVRAENELAEYRSELSQLTQRLMAQEKTTTRNVAQALHDRLGQTLTAIRLYLDALAVRTPSDAASHERLRSLIDAATAEVRQMLIELRPPLLDEQGLAAALDNEVLSASRIGVRVDLELDPDLETLRWPPDVEYAAFMVAREALGNALRHAEATRVRLSLEGGATSLRLRVADDGRGIGPDRQVARPGHLGMVGMRERALAIDGRFEVHSPEGGGTVIELHWEPS